MPRSRYPWSDGEPVLIKQHSVAKHEVLRAYLVAYLRTLVVQPGQKEVSVTLVDGFAGGGRYIHEDTGQLLLGSPFVFLEAVKEAQALLSIARKNPLEWRLKYFFVEKSKAACNMLRQTLLDEGYGDSMGRDIHLLEGSFEKHAHAILGAIRDKSPISGRSIFLLDQYGYSEVPASQIRSILTTLPRAEVILTFAVDAFINYASDNPVTQTILSSLDLPDALRGRTIDEIKTSEKDFRLFIQSQLYKGLVENCGAKYYTVFFIRTKGHGVYWLVHLSQHPRARDVMTQVH